MLPVRLLQSTKLTRKQKQGQAWRALEEAYNEGKLKAIGVSNFLIEDLESLMETAKVKPMVNQVLCHISNTPAELIEFCQKNDILVEAYFPIAHGEILNQPEIKAIAGKYGVSVLQLCIRYTIQLGAVSLPKTANPEHMKTNAEVDFEITAEDMETLKKFKKIENYAANSGFPVYGGNKMFLQEDNSYNDIRQKSLNQWLDEMEKHEDIAVRGGVKLTREYIQYLNDEINRLKEENALKNEYLKKMSKRQ